MSTLKGAAAVDARRTPAPGERSYLGPGCVFEGEIEGTGSLECHGTLTGTVRMQGDVVIGQSGRAKAHLQARRVLVEGSLEGDAVADEKVEVGPAGQVHGDIRAPSVGFAEGAVFEGSVEMRKERAGDDR